MPSGTAAAGPRPRPSTASSDILPHEAPDRSALAKNIKRISAETWRKINHVILKYAQVREVENGQKVRIEPYKDLLRVTRETIHYAEQAIEPLRQEQSPMAGLARRLARELEHYVPLALQVVSRTERRVLKGESVPAEERLVSIFELHTDIIRKDRRDTYYGHKVTLTGGTSGFVLDWVVEDGSPADSTLLVRMLERHKALYGCYPRQATADGGFATKDNLASAKTL